MRALEEANSIDLDARAALWRSDGWDYTPTVDSTADLDDADGVPFGTRDTDLSGSRFRSYVRNEPRR